MTAGPEGVQVHALGLCESPDVGPGTRVWAFAHVLPGARVGRDCNVCDHVFIENDVQLGDRVTVKSGVQLWDGLRVGDDVFIGPNATFANDPWPRSKRHLASYPRTVIEAGASIGAGAIVLPGLRIGRSAMVGAGAVVTRDVPPHAVVVGSPARVVRYESDGGPPPGAGMGPRPQPAGRRPVGIGAVDLLELPGFGDERGELVVVELETHVPFRVRRVFFVHGVPTKETRGEHAHLACHQLLVCTNGSVNILVDDGTRRAEVVLDRPTIALHVPPMVWASMYRFTADAVLTVFASDPYDAADYLRTYEAFLDALEALAARGAPPP